MEIFEQLAYAFFTDSVREDVLKVAVAGVMWRELHSMRQAMESGFRALTERIDNHERRLRDLEPNDAAGTAD